jgi:hypothetical protein
LVGVRCRDDAEVAAEVAHFAAHEDLHVLRLSIVRSRSDTMVSRSPSAWMS